MTLIEQAHAISAAPKGKAPKKPTRLPVPPRKPAHVAATASNDPFSIPPMLDRTNGKTSAQIRTETDAVTKRLATQVGPAKVITLPTKAAVAKAQEPRKAKARVRVEHMLAKKSGETAKMPLTGKAALQAIANAAVDNGAKITKCPTGASGRDKVERAIDKKARKGTPAKKPATKDGPRKGSKVDLIAGLLKRKGGCTTADVLKATGWPAVSMPQQAKAAGLKLRKEKKAGEVTRYFA